MIYKLALRVGRKPKNDFLWEKPLIRMKACQGIILQRFFYFQSWLIVICEEIIIDIAKMEGNIFCMD